MNYTEENIRLILGLKIKQLRLDKKLSLKELSATTGISISYLNEIEKGKKNPKPTKLAQIAESLNVTYDWLVSLQMGKRLEPFTDLLHSNSIRNLPLAIFGIDSSKLMELFASEPARIGAFVNIIRQTAASNDISLEAFYFSALRGYLEMHENYFPDIEREVDHFVKEHRSKFSNTPSATELKNLLEELYGYEIRSEPFKETEGAEEFRYLKINKNYPKLLLNRTLSENQKAFAFAKELGSERLKISKRTCAFPLMSINTFDELLNDFKTSYFASALLINKDLFKEKANILFKATQWQPWLFEEMVRYFHATPETLLFRMSSLGLKYLGIEKMFFMKIDHKIDSQSFYITEEYHLSGHHESYQSHKNEHYCRRWVSIKVLEQLKSQVHRRDMSDEMLTNAQITDFYDSNMRYLVISIARPSYPTRDEISSISIGIQLNDNKSEKIGFLNDPKIKSFQAGHTCERCPAKSCMERVAPPSKLLSQETKGKKMLALDKLIDNYA